MEPNIEQSLNDHTFTSEQHSAETLAHVAEFLQMKYDVLMQESCDLKAKQTKHSKWVQRFKEDLKNLKTMVDAGVFD